MEDEKYIIKRRGSWKAEEKQANWQREVCVLTYEKQRRGKEFLFTFKFQLLIKIYVPYNDHSCLISSMEEPGFLLRDFKI